MSPCFRSPGRWVGLGLGRPDPPGARQSERLPGAALVAGRIEYRNDKHYQVDTEIRWQVVCLLDIRSVDSSSEVFDCGQHSVMASIGSSTLELRVPDLASTGLSTAMSRWQPERAHPLR